MYTVDSLLSRKYFLTETIDMLMEECISNKLNNSKRGKKSVYKSFLHSCEEEGGGERERETTKAE